MKILNTIKRLLSLGTLLSAALLLVPGVATANMAGTGHDFSLTGWAGGEICIACHTPHNANAAFTLVPLWNNREQTVASYDLYTSVTGTLDATMVQPAGMSKLCLSCHDGTVALENFGGVTGGGTIIGGTGNFGTDLNNDHPVSFVYNAALATADGELFDPATQSAGLPTAGTIEARLLFGATTSATVECASCHDVHNSASVAKLLVKSNVGSALCLTCHDK